MIRLEPMRHVNSRNMELANFGSCSITDLTHQIELFRGCFGASAAVSVDLEDFARQEVDTDLDSGCSKPCAVRGNTMSHSLQ